MKKAFNMFIILMLAFSIFSVFGLVNTVKSATTSNFGFENGGDIGELYNETHNGVRLLTSFDGSDFEISNEIVRTGDKSFKFDYWSSGAGNKYFNYTYASDYLTEWYTYTYLIDGGAGVWFTFFNSSRYDAGADATNDSLLLIEIDYILDELQYFDGSEDSVVKICDITSYSSWVRLGFKINNVSSIDLFFDGDWYNNLNASNTTLNLSQYKIDMIQFNPISDYNMYWDDHYIVRADNFSDGYDATPENDTNITGGTIYFKLFNIENGKQIDFGLDNSGYWYNTYPYIISDILPNNYGYEGQANISEGWGWTIENGMIKVSNINFDEGIVYTFYFSGNPSQAQKFKCYVFDTQSYFGVTAPDTFYFSSKTYNQAIYDGQTYSVFLYPTDYTDGVDYEWCEDNEYIQICLNKKVYDYGETVRCKFRFKSQKMLNNNLPSYNWQLRNCKRTDVVNVVQAGTPFINYKRQDAGDFDFNNNWQNVQWVLTEYNSYGYKKYFAKYLCAMMHPWLPWGTNYNLCKIPFWCTGEEFTPSGTLSANPNPATLGQIVTISWTANNSGKIKILSPFSTDGNPNYVKSQPFEYSDATRFFNFTPDVMGTFEIQLYVDGIETGNTSDDPIKTLDLIVNPKTGEEGSPGQFGFGVAYLWTPMYRLVAGLDNVSIYYRTYRNNSQLFIYSPRNETTSYSTTCSNWSDNVHNFHLPNWAQIGVWNVTFLAGHINGTNVTLRSSFNVINEEGNWVQFGKNVYYDDEMFNLWLKHDYRVSLTFFKNDVAQGEDIIFAKGEHDGEEVIINPEFVQPSPGFWRVEMNRINELNRIYKLAEWTCTVKPAPIETTASGVFGYNLQTFMLNIDPTIRAIVGIGICIGLLLIPLGVTMKMKRPINIPPVVYAIFFLVGVGVSYIIYLWGLEIMFFLCSMTALVLVGLYFMGKQKSAPAEA